MPDLLGSVLPLPVQKEDIVFGTGTGTVAANSTVYLYCNLKQGELLGGSIGAETGQLTVLLILRPGTLKNLIAHATAVPGGVQTYTYTVRINGVPTSITCATPAASRDSSDLVNTAKVVAGDRVTIQLVTSVTAAVTGHNATIGLETPAKKIPFEGLFYSSGGTTLAAGATRYLNSMYMRGAGGGYDATITTNQVVHSFTRKGTLKNLVVFAGGAPGAGQTLIFTVMVNGNPSTLTATIGGAVDVSAQDLTNIVQIDPSDLVAVRVVNSAGGAAVTISAYYEFEEDDYVAA